MYQLIVCLGLGEARLQGRLTLDEKILSAIDGTRPLRMDRMSVEKKKTLFKLSHVLIFCYVNRYVCYLGIKALSSPHLRQLTQIFLSEPMTCDRQGYGQLVVAM